MEIYLPIAEMPINIISILLLGGFAGVLSGIFGIGGGFILVPFLIFMGVPPAVAVASTSNQIIATSISGFMAHFRRRNVDIKMGLFLLIGGIIGSGFGVVIFAVLKNIGQLDLAISLIYVIFLGIVGVIMAIESIKAIRRVKQGIEPKSITQPHWMNALRLPFIVHFSHSNINISALIPIIIGLCAGILVSLTGIGGGFVMIPAMIYLLGMPTHIVIGTSLFQIIFTTSNATFWQAYTTQTVDIVLAMLLLLGSVVGVQFGARMGAKLPAEKLRALLALMVIGMALKLAIDLFVPPQNPYSFTPL